MNPNRHRRLSEVFLRAAELDRDERERFLNETCADDAELRDDVERMLDLDQTSFLNQPALGEAFRLDAVVDLPGAAAMQNDDAEARPRVIGNYRILSVLGEGGMGVVYRAEQMNPMRPVALKVLRRGIADRTAVRRFELEAQVLGRLQHDNIARIYEAGSFRDLRGEWPFLAMELVDGKPLPEYLEQSQPNETDRIDLMLQICEAVEHAHQRGVIHRDLKPANILVQPTGRVKVLDFGIARVVTDDWQVSLVTVTGQFLGTLAYMSPEQIDVDPTCDSWEAVDTRTDVYALGVLLFELLTGALPYDVHNRSFAQSVDMLRNNEPKRIEQINASFRSSAWSDLSIIVSKAIEKERCDRYASVGEFAADLRRFLAGEPIAARPQTTLYQLRKFARRHTELVSGVAIAVALLILGIVGLSKYAIDVSRAKHEADGARLEAVSARDEVRARSAELEQVAEFQAAMLSDIDVHLMGLRLREDLIAEFRAAQGSDQIADEVYEEFQRSLAAIDFTTTARKGLQRNVFDRALEAIGREFNDQPLVQARLFQSIADSLESLDMLDEAMRVQKRALAIRRELLGSEHPDTLTSVLAMGYLLVGAAAYEEAERHYTEALDGRRSVLGEDHPDTLLVKRRLANLCRMTGRLEEAIEFGRAALEGLQRTLGEDDRRTIDALHTMAPLMYGIGDIHAASEYSRRALEGRRRLLGPDHPDTLISMNNTGVILFAHGQVEEAMKYLNEALDGRTRVLGRQHRLTLQSMTHVARGLATLGEFDDAVEMTRVVLEANLTMFGERHHHTLSTMSTLGEILMDAGRYDDAAPYVDQACEFHRALHGNQHPETLRAMVAKTRLLLETGRFEEAQSLGSQAQDMADRMLPDDHLLRKTILRTNAETFVALGRVEDARDALAAAKAILLKHFDEGHDHLETVTEELTALDEQQVHQASEP